MEGGGIHSCSRIDDDDGNVLGQIATRDFPTTIFAG